MCFAADYINSTFYDSVSALGAETHLLNDQRTRQKNDVFDYFLGFLFL